jgi:hypothetical protein
MGVGTHSLHIVFSRCKVTEGMIVIVLSSASRIVEKKLLGDTVSFITCVPIMVVPTLKVWVNAKAWKTAASVNLRFDGPKVVPIP